MGGIFILFLSNIALVIGTQQWLHSKHSAGGSISGGDKRLMSSLPLVSTLLTLLSLWWMVTKNKSITSSDLLPNVPCLSVI